MRYLIDPEFRTAPSAKSRASGSSASTALRQELSARNILWASSRNHAHEISLGAVPAVLYREDEAGVHGNFIDSSYRAIKSTASWKRRLEKVHTSAHRALLSRDAGRRELDSSNSSDALLMNIFCHPETLQSAQVRALMSIDGNAEAVFGHRPGIPLKNGRRDATENDFKVGSLLVEAKLTEADFTAAPMRLVERYRDFEATFNVHELELAENGYVRSYQLIRGILAVAGIEEGRFCVLCDSRRTDLIDAWHRVIMAVRHCDLRCRLQLLTWQELAVCLPAELQTFLADKFGIVQADRAST